MQFKAAFRLTLAMEQCDSMTDGGFSGLSPAMWNQHLRRFLSVKRA